MSENLHLWKFSTNYQMDFNTGEKFKRYNVRALTHILLRCYGQEQHLTALRIITTIPVQALVGAMLKT